MRAILVFTILLLGLTGAALEPKYSLRGDDLRSSRDPIDGLVEIESSAHRSDRLNLAALGPRLLHVEVLRPELRDAPLRLASLNSDVGGASNDTPTAPPQPTSLDNLCNDEEASNLKATDQAAMPVAPEQTRQSKHERVREARRISRESQASKPAPKREAKHEPLRVAHEGHGAMRVAKHEAAHIAREGHVSKHEAARTARGNRERHRSA
jgi:hypothetical protein